MFFMKIRPWIGRRIRIGRRLHVNQPLHGKTENIPNIRREFADNFLKNYFSRS